ncbi:glycosyltransferase family 4 protein [Sutcliffiella horikoshii]|uniref:Glycosyltransferase family 4 protein n=1 Tax=Sutcliffiella horikoshii TaxID=79883 RepID=A0A5D4T5T6_9BACI|nr:glycosyltransferase [Sutcliffiella horikoshii]TYS69842.1 glycosyltransferase family 4 protein [Sutcliffiella horikoshii]
MRKKVCMFVWNHFTNDARVMRECTALSENQYSVDLICIEDPNDKNLPLYEEINSNFKVFRVKRYPSSLLMLQKVYRVCFINKLATMFSVLVWLFFTYFFPLMSVVLTILFLLLLKTRLKTVVIRGSIILRMVLKGLKKNYKIYHANDLNTLTQAYICSKIRLRSRQLVYDSHEVQTSRTGYDSSLYAILEKFYIKKIDRMIVENHTRAKYNQELYGFYPSVVYNYPFKQVHNITESKNLHKILNLSPNEKILLYQGGIQVGRGLEKLIDAVPLFREGILVFIGDGKIKKHLEYIVKEKQLDNRVKFLPKVPLGELPAYTKNAYLGFQVLNNVCFNHYSASSNKLFEYLMAGVPVVACGFPEIKKVVEENQVGICVDSHNYESIAEGVNVLLSNDKLRQKFADNTRYASSKYNWENEKINFLEVYASLGS